MSYLNFASNNMSGNFYNSNLLFEDTHPRNKQTTTLNAKQNAITLKNLGDIKTRKELNEKLKQIATSYQLKKAKKEAKKDKKIARKEGRTEEITKYLRDLFNRPTGNFNKFEEQEIHNYFYRAYEQYMNAELPPNIAAAYLPLFVAIYTNPNSIYTQFPLFKERLVNHEIQHYIDQMYVKNVYGRSAANKITAQSAKASKGTNDEYLSDPMEYNAMMVGSNIDNVKNKNIHNVYKPKTQAIMDKAVHGKSTPKVTDDMYYNQFPLEGLL